MLIVFFNYRDVVYSEFLPTGRIMRRLRQTIRKKRPELRVDIFWFLDHDIAPSHSSLILREFFAKFIQQSLTLPPWKPF